MNTKALLESGESLNLDKGFASFLPVLSRVMTLSSGDVMELGTGIYSTPFLHWICFAQKRTLVSYENNKEYFKTFQDYQENFHKIFLVEDFEMLKPEKHFSVIFIDHFPQEDRRNQLEKLIKNANFIIVHDTSPDDFANVSKYRFDYAAVPGTSIFSNFVDVRKLKI